MSRKNIREGEVTDPPAETQETSMGTLPVGYPLGGPIPTNLAALQQEEKARQAASDAANGANAPAEDTALA